MEELTSKFVEGCGTVASLIITIQAWIGVQPSSEVYYNTEPSCSEIALWGKPPSPQISACSRPCVQTYLAVWRWVRCHQGTSPWGPETWLGRSSGQAFGKLGACTSCAEGTDGDEHGQRFMTARIFCGSIQSPFCTAFVITCTPAPLHATGPVVLCVFLPLPPRPGQSIFSTPQVPRSQTRLRLAFTFSPHR